MLKTRQALFLLCLPLIYASFPSFPLEASFLQKKTPGAAPSPGAAGQPAKKPTAISNVKALGTKAGSPISQPPPPPPAPVVKAGTPASVPAAGAPPAKKPGFLAGTKSLLGASPAATNQGAEAGAGAPPPPPSGPMGLLGKVKGAAPLAGLPIPGASSAAPQAGVPSPQAPDATGLSSTPPVTPTNIPTPPPPPPSGPMGLLGKVKGAAPLAGLPIPGASSAAPQAGVASPQAPDATGLSSTPPVTPTNIPTPPPPPPPPSGPMGLLGKVKGAAPLAGLPIPGASSAAPQAGVASPQAPDATGLSSTPPVTPTNIPTPPPPPPLKGTPTSASSTGNAALDAFTASLVTTEIKEARCFATLHCDNFEDFRDKCLPKHFPEGTDLSAEVQQKAAATLLKDALIEGTKAPKASRQRPLSYPNLVLGGQNAACLKTAIDAAERERKKNPEVPGDFFIFLEAAGFFNPIQTAPHVSPQPSPLVQAQAQNQPQVQPQAPLPGTPAVTPIPTGSTPPPQSQVAPSPVIVPLSQPPVDTAPIVTNPPPPVVNATLENKAPTAVTPPPAPPPPPVVNATLENKAPTAVTPPPAPPPPPVVNSAIENKAPTAVTPPPAPPPPPVVNATLENKAPTAVTPPPAPPPPPVVNATLENKAPTAVTPPPAPPLPPVVNSTLENKAPTAVTPPPAPPPPPVVNATLENKAPTAVTPPISKGKSKAGAKAPKKLKDSPVSAPQPVSMANQAPGGAENPLAPSPASQQAKQGETAAPQASPLPQAPLSETPLGKIQDNLPLQSYGNDQRQGNAEQTVQNYSQDASSFVDRPIDLKPPQFEASPSVKRHSTLHAELPPPPLRYDEGEENFEQDEYDNNLNEGY